MKLIRIEWLKLRHHNFFWIGMGLYILSIVLLITLLGNFKLIEQKEGEGMITFQTLGEAGLYKLPYIWQHVTYLAGFFKFIPAFLLIFFISNEYQYKTYRQNVIDGLSIGQFYTSKLYSAVFFTLISLLTVAITGFVMALLHNDNLDWSSFTTGTDYFAAYFAEVFFMIIFTIFLTVLFRRSTITIIFILAYYFIIEQLVGFALGEPLKYYLPTAPSRELNLQPITRLIGADALLGTESPDSVSTKYLLTTFLYTIIFAAGGYVILKKRDL